MLRRHFALGALLAVCATLLTQRPADAGCGPLGGLCDTVNDNVIKPAGDKVVDPAKSAFVSGANWAADRGKDAGNAMKDGASYVASGDWAKAAAKLGESARNSVLEAIGNGVKTLKNTGVSIGKLAREGVQSALKEAAKHKDLLRYASVASNLAKDAWKAGKTPGVSPTRS